MTAARIVLFECTQPTSMTVELTAELDTDDGHAEVGGLVLRIPGEETALRLVDGTSLRIEAAHLAKQGDHYVLTQAAGSFQFARKWKFDAGKRVPFFGRHLAADTQVGLSVHVPSGAPSLETPFLEICCEGRVAVDAGSVLASVEVGWCVIVDELGSVALPSLRVRPPGELHVPSLRIPWDGFPTLPMPVRLPAWSISLPGLPLRIGFDQLEIDVKADGLAKLSFAGFRIEGVAGFLVGRLDLDFRVDGSVGLSFDAPQLHGLHKLVLIGLNNDCIQLRWKHAELRPLLALFGHEMDLEVPPLPQDLWFSLRVHIWIDRDKFEVDEIRLDWGGLVTGQKFELTLPGIGLEVEQPQMLTLLARRPRKDGAFEPARLTFLSTVGVGKPIARIYTTFAWVPGDGLREVHRDGGGEDRNRLLSIDATTKPAGDAKTVSLAIFDFPLTGSHDPRYFKVLKSPLEPLSVVGPCATTGIELGSNGHEDFPKLSVILETSEAFELPILRRPHLQSIKVTFPERLSIPDGVVIRCDLGLVVLLEDPTEPGDKVELVGGATLKFDLERMAFTFKGQASFEVRVPEKHGKLLGLDWRFVPNNDGVAFLFHIAERNYQLLQADGARFEVHYNKATMPGEPLVFAIEDFALTPGGVGLTARISDRPVRLNGVETQFRFTSGVLQIKDDVVAGFTIAGSGPLPPDLVGDAVADAWLQFAQEPGQRKVRLHRGGARIRGSNKLSCRATRFEFELNPPLGLEFVHENEADHLYFTLSGTARYRPLPGDDQNGPLAWLPKIEIQLVNCPLTGNARVLSKHVRFLVDLPKKMEFSLLGCFKMELRGIGFVPQFDKFGDLTAAMRLAGQIKFADVGDVLDTKIDLHDLFVALPAPGSFLPRLHMKGLGVRIAQGETFKLEGAVDFFDGDEIEPGVRAYGFNGEGTITVKGLPEIAASFGFVRARRQERDPWKKAWFLYLEARKISLRIPVFEIYIREIGFGFGYRYTLASIAAADKTPDVKAMLKELKRLSRTQGNLSRRDQWSLDLDGDDPKWSLALRGLIAAASAQVSPFTGYDPVKEAEIASLYLMDAVLAVRSDLTFLLSARAWLNTNYHDFHQKPGLKDRPLLSGFAMLSPRQSRFLANLSSNPDADFGDHPPVPEFLKRAARQSQFSATLLLEPGLVHYELGWPNQLRWSEKIGPLEAEFRGGTIFRLSSREIVMGQSFQARGKVTFGGSVGGGAVGAEVRGTADVSFGARYIGVIAFRDPLGQSALHGALNVEVRINLSIHAWFRINAKFFKVNINLHFSIQLGFTASLQVGVFLPPKENGLLGKATVSISVFGRQLSFDVRAAINEDSVVHAESLTKRFLSMGLEADDVEAVPGTGRARVSSWLRPRSADILDARALAAPDSPPVVGAAPSPRFAVPQYALGQAEHPGETDRVGKAVTWLLLVPQSAVRRSDPDPFFPVPPTEDVLDAGRPFDDFEWTVDKVPAGIALQRVGPNGPQDPDGSVFRWQIRWKDEVGDLEPDGSADDAVVPKKPVKLFEYLRYAWIHEPLRDEEEFGEVRPIKDPRAHWIADNAPPVEDHRVRNPTDSAFEAAVRGAAERFAGPYFRFDPDSEYDQGVLAAYDARTTVYTEHGRVPSNDDKRGNSELEAEQSAAGLRSSILQAITRDFFDYVSAPPGSPERTRLEATSLAFRLGVVFRATGSVSDSLDNLSGTVRQRDTTGRDLCPAADAKPVHIANPRGGWFSRRTPEWVSPITYAHAHTIAIHWALRFPGGEGDAEAHVRHYRVRREHLGGNDPVHEFTFKPATVLCPATVVEQGHEVTVVKRLLPRFQLVDHFDNEVSADIDALTAKGKTYLYTITPVDLAGNDSPLPLTVVATRYPAEPPLVPSDGELVVTYGIDAHGLSDVSPTDTPLVREPTCVKVFCSDPVERGGQVPVAVDKTYLVLRRERTLPVGFFGADEDVRGGDHRGLVVTNARRLRTDVVIELTKAPQEGGDNRGGTRHATRTFTVPIATLREEGILPPRAENMRAAWRPEGWRVFLQTEAPPLGDEAPGDKAPGARSGLAPVTVKLEVRARPKPAGEPRLYAEASDASGPSFTRVVSLLEWIPDPVRLGLLPPEDVAAEAGFTKVPMPALDHPEFWSNLDVPVEDAEDIPGLNFELHPARTRATKLVWNQGPSGTPGHPRALHARYQVYEFDVLSTPGDALDAERDKLVDFRTWAERARLVKVLEADLVPAGDISKLPSEIGDPQGWEAWYPSTARRILRKREDVRLGSWPAGRDALYGPWYSWRESSLKWPDLEYLVAPRPGGTTDDLPQVRVRQRHPWLQDLVAVLSDLEEFEVLTKANTPIDDALPAYRVEVAPQPARGGGEGRDASATEPRPGALAAFLKGTATETDPYGWGILQRAGLSIAFRVYGRAKRDFLAGTELSRVVRRGIAVQGLRHVFRLTPTDRSQAIFVTVRAPKDEPCLVREVEDPTERLERVAKDTQHSWTVAPPFPADDPRLIVTVWGRRTTKDTQGVKCTATNTNTATVPESGLDVQRFLHVEHLFQPARRTQIDPKEAESGSPARFDHTLALVQVSLRPTYVQKLQYVRFQFDAQSDGKSLIAGSSVEVTVTRPEHEVLPTSFVIEGSRVVQMSSPSVTEVVTVPRSGRVEILVRTPFPDQVLVKIGREAPPACSQRLAPYEWATAAMVDRWWDKKAQDVSGFQDLCQVIALAEPETTAELLRAAADTQMAGALVSDLCTWSARFFDHGGDPEVGKDGKLAETSGPWIASAYPRSASTLPVTPDAAGRVTTYRLVEDLWAHAYRYVVRPRGRYELLWDAIGRSDLVAEASRGKLATMQRQIPCPRGGADVALSRLRPLAAPVVLSSRRLDPPVPIDAIPRPGRTWEVLIGQHPEQALVERNRTLAGHLEYRQLAAALLRSFDSKRAHLRDWRTLLKDVVDVEEKTFEEATWELAPRLPRPVLPTVTSRPDHLDLKHVSDDDAVTLDLSLRTTDFTQGLVALQVASLPFYYTHTLLVVAQAAHVVSPMTVVRQQDFAYQSPVAYAEMEAHAPKGGSRSRAIRITLARLWDALPDDAKRVWPFEEPESAKDERRRRRSSVPDPDVVYALVLSPDEEHGGSSGNEEVVAEFRFDPNDPNQKYGYVSAQLKGPFEAEVVGLTRSTRAGHGTVATSHAVLETTLVRRPSNGGTEPVDEIVQPVSSRRALPALEPPLRVWRLDDSSPPWPRSRVLRFEPPADPARVKEAHQAIRELMSAVDPTFAEALQRILGGTLTVETSVGIEQLSEIHDEVGIAGGKVTWTGTLHRRQRDVLEIWSKTSLFRSTFEDLLRELTTFALPSEPLDVEPISAQDIDDVGLGARVGLDATQGGVVLLWKDALTEPTTRAEIEALGDLAILRPDVAPAIQSLIQDIGAIASHRTEVTIAEPWWRPRPALSGILKECLLVAEGVVACTGMLTREEGRRLRDHAAHEPDRRAMVELYDRAACIGLLGRRLMLVARRGAASPAPACPVVTTLEGK